MTSVSFHRLDWRIQFEALQPFLEGMGGVVHVHAAGERAPKLAFVKVLRAEMETRKWPYEHSVLLVSPNDAGTHYVPDIVRQCFNVFKLAPPPVGKSAHDSITIGDRIKANGDVTISNINIMSDVDQYDTAARDDRNIQLLCTQLRQALRSRRCALIFTDTHAWGNSELAILEQRLWTGALAELVDHGLLVIDVFDPYLMAAKPSVWPPDPSRVLQLPDQFDDITYAHAVDDLISIAIGECWSQTVEEARGFARGVLDTSHGIQDAYSRLGLAVRRKGVNNASSR